MNPGGLPRSALLAARAEAAIALSVPVYTEIAEVLARPKLQRWISAERRDEILAVLSAAAVWSEPRVRITDCRDPKDDIYLELASSAGADVIVSGDGDLLSLDPWRSIRVLRPAEFLSWMSLHAVRR